MKRIVKPELLDVLPPDDPPAIHSRSDLRRVNAWMRNHAIMAAALQTAVNGSAPRQITDLGAGDGHFLVRVAQLVSGYGAPASGTARNGDSGMNMRRAGGRRAAAWDGVQATLLERQKIISPETVATFKNLGWRAEAVAADVFSWLPAARGLDVVVANLFLHHFEDARLAELFRGIAGQARLLVAIEPRRSPWPLLCCRLLWLIGCNSVTRHDAAISVRAGFSGRELSALWPADNTWQLTERRTGFFSHLFVARRTR